MRKVIIEKGRFVALLLVLILVLAFTVGCNSSKPKEVKDLEKVILTINDKDYTLQDIMYVLYVVESNAADDINRAIALGETESDYWLEKDDVTGKTVRELTKESVLDVAENVIIQAQLAEKEGYVLTEDDLDTVDMEVQDVLDYMYGQPEYLARTGFTKENLTELVKQFNLAYKYSMDQISKIQVDQSMIDSDIKPEDYAQVEIEYIQFWTGEIDMDGNYNLFEPEKITEILNQAQAAYEEVAEGKDIITVGDEYYSEDYTVEAGTQPLFNNAEDNEENLYNAFKDLKVGELYPGVIETMDGYYIIRLVNDNCTEAYDQMVEEVARSVKQSTFDDEFDKLKADYNIQINEENWKNIEIGNYAYPKMEIDSDTEFEYDEDNLEEDSEDSGFDIIDEDGAVG